MEGLVLQYLSVNATTIVQTPEHVAQVSTQANMANHASIECQRCAG
jgi:hypothetical protein